MSANTARAPNVSQKVMKEITDLDLAGKDINIKRDPLELAKQGVDKERLKILAFREEFREFVGNLKALDYGEQAEALLSHWNAIKKAVRT